MSLLDVPEAGFRRSVNKHNSDVMVVCDWIEGSSLFFNRAVSRMDIRDFLCTDYYSDQTFAMDFVDIIWGELRRRVQWLAKAPVFKLGKDKIEPIGQWKNLLGYAFCLMLTTLQRYDREQHKKLFAKSFIKQGSLFEELSEQSLSKLRVENPTDRLGKRNNKPSVQTNCKPGGV